MLVPLGRENILPEFRTRVWKDRYLKGYWNVTYYMPYSGILSAQFMTWEDAMNEACQIEKWRMWI